jgi:hypothetical protein
MRDLKYLKTFESFSIDVVNEEEIIGDLFKKGPISKAVAKFKEDNKEDFSKLKEAEKSGKNLKEIQSILNKKLIEYKKSELKNLLTDRSDFNTASRELNDIINNITPNDTRTSMQKIGSGVSGGFPGHEKRIRK